MWVLNICNNADVLSIMRIVKIVILIIKISVPIILLLSLMIGYLRAVKDHDDDALNKVNKSAVAKIIAALLVFFIPDLVNTIADAVDVNKNSYISCIKLATTESINQALYDTALERVHTARNTLLHLVDYLRFLRLLVPYPDRCTYLPTLGIRHIRQLGLL